MMAGIVSQQALMNASGPSPGGDLYWENVVLLMSFDDAANRMLDKTGRHVPVAIGAPTFPTGVAGQALWSNNSGANRIEVPNSPDFQFGGGDFTVELFQSRQNTSNTSGLIGNFRTAGNQRSWALYRSVGNMAAYMSLNGIAQSSFNTGLEPGTPNFPHFALTREGDVYRVFRGGVLASSLTLSGALHPSTGPLDIGSFDGAGVCRNYIDEIRITKGVCRYNANFTPPTAPFPDYY